LAVSDCLDESGLIVYKRLNISGDGAVLGEDSSDSDEQDEVPQHIVDLLQLRLLFADK